MGIKEFEELDVFEQARELTRSVYNITRKDICKKDFALTEQIRRAAISIMSNIAEGFERGSNAEFIQFLYIAKGSCAEVRAQLMVAVDQSYISKDEYVSLLEKCKKISKMLNGFIKYLRESGIKKRNL